MASMLIPRSKEAEERETRKRSARWARNTKSEFVCAGCGEYTGRNHINRPRQEGCIMGSET